MSTWRAWNASATCAQLRSSVGPLDLEPLLLVEPEPVGGEQRRGVGDRQVADPQARVSRVTRRRRRGAPRRLGPVVEQPAAGAEHPTARTDDTEAEQSAEQRAAVERGPEGQVVIAASGHQSVELGERVGSRTGRAVHGGRRPRAASSRSSSATSHEAVIPRSPPRRSATRSPRCNASSTSWVTSTTVRSRSAADVAQPVLQRPAGERVERGERLVEQQQRWRGDDGPRDRDALRLAAGQLGGIASARAREPEDVEQAIHLARGRCRGWRGTAARARRSRGRRATAAGGRPGTRCRPRPPSVAVATSSSPPISSSRPATMRSSVDLPHPDGPSKDTHLAPFDLEVEVAEGGDGTGGRRVAFAPPVTRNARVPIAAGPPSGIGSGRKAASRSRRAVADAAR